MLDWAIGLFSFRNASHQYWFLGSMIVFLMSLVFCHFSKSKDHFGVFILSHAVTAISAFFKVLILKQSSPVYSVDCIWFNALMAAVYIGLLFYKIKRDEQGIPPPSFQSKSMRI